jgi:hypothetical protein
MIGAARKLIGPAELSAAEAGVMAGPERRCWWSVPAAGPADPFGNANRADEEPVMVFEKMSIGPRQSRFPSLGLMTCGREGIEHRANSVPADVAGAGGGSAPEGPAHGDVLVAAGIGPGRRADRTECWHRNLPAAGEDRSPLIAVSIILGASNPDCLGAATGGVVRQGPCRIGDPRRSPRGAGQDASTYPSPAKSRR